MNVRDYLNCHKDDAKAYSKLKETLADRYPEDRETYTASKSEFAGQEVCPVGEIGFYYPPVVYVGEDGRLYCVYEYKEEIDIFDTPEEIIADQLSNHMPVAVKEYQAE